MNDVWKMPYIEHVAVFNDDLNFSELRLYLYLVYMCSRHRMYLADIRREYLVNHFQRIVKCYSPETIEDFFDAVINSLVHKGYLVVALTPYEGVPDTFKRYEVPKHREYEGGGWVNFDNEDERIKAKMDNAKIKA